MCVTNQQSIHPWNGTCIYVMGWSDQQHAGLLACIRFFYKELKNKTTGIEMKCSCRVRAMVFNAHFTYISVTLWSSAFLVEETEVAGVNHRPAASH